MINNYAIVESCGRQFWLEPSKFYDFSGFGHISNIAKEESIELAIQRRQNIKNASIVIFNKVLLVSNEKGFHLGKPFLNEFLLEGNLLPGTRKKSKIQVFKMRSKKKFRRKMGSKILVNRVRLEEVLKKYCSKNNNNLEFLIK